MRDYNLMELNDHNFVRLFNNLLNFKGVIP